MTEECTHGYVSVIRLAIGVPLFRNWELGLGLGSGRGLGLGASESFVAHCRQGIPGDRLLVMLMTF